MNLNLMFVAFQMLNGVESKSNPIRSSSLPTTVLSSSSSSSPRRPLVVGSGGAQKPIRTTTTLSVAGTASRSGLVESQELSEQDVIQMLGDECEALASQARSVMEIDFQQAINCCGFTSVAYALTSIGCPTTVDDLFLEIGVNVESAVGDGMTLAEVYDATLRFVKRRNLPVFVECYHFDEQLNKEQDFVNACTAEGDSGTKDVVICNFHSGIAHGWQSGGGGHFSVLMGLDSDTNKVVMSDVHGIKYGKFWSTPLPQLYRAMSDHDSCGRARGVIRFGRKDANPPVRRPIRGGLQPTVVDWANPPSRDCYNSDVLSKYIPTKWDALLGSRNMEGASALAAAVRLMEGDDAPISQMDSIMRALQESYTQHLNVFSSSSKLLSMAQKLRDTGHLNAKPFIHELDDFTPNALRHALTTLQCGNIHSNVAIMVPFDLNRAVGFQLLPEVRGEAAALSHGSKTWSLIAAFDPNADDDDMDGVLIAPAHGVIVNGRVWSCSIGGLVDGMKAMNMKELVVLQKE